MLETIISVIGLGILGVDPIAAIYVMGIGLKKEKKIKLRALMFSFYFTSVVIGVCIAYIFGHQAIIYIQNLNFIRAFVELFIAFILISIIFKTIIKKKKEAIKPKVVEGSIFKYLSVGLIFGLLSFTDPT